MDSVFSSITFPSNLNSSEPSNRGDHLFPNRLRVKTYCTAGPVARQDFFEATMAPGTETEPDQLTAENISGGGDALEKQSDADCETASAGSAAAEEASEDSCLIRCANCDELFSPDRFEEHVCEYDERKKRIVPSSVLDGHPCLRQLEDNMDQWKRLTKKKGRSDGTSTEGGGEKKDKRKQKRESTEKRRMYECRHCERKFVHATGLEKHLAKMHADKEGDVIFVGELKQPKKEETGDPFKVCLKCMKCGMVFGTLEKMMDHLETVDWERELECEDGSYMDNGKLALRKAFRIVILTTVFQCEFCDKHFSDLPSLCEHQSLHDPAIGFECTLCEIKIPCMKDMLFHRLNECVFRDAWNDEFRGLSKYFACNVCDEQFQSLGALYEHRYANYHLFPRSSIMEENDITGQFKVGCENCGVSFDNADTILMHYTTNHATKKHSTIGLRRQPAEKDAADATSPNSSTRPYLCEVCGKTYTQSSHLWQHLRFHNGIRPFICPETGCNRSFTIRPDLKDHIRKCHTGERPYVCDLCDKRFLTGSVYYQHRLIHRGDRRYGCDECNKRFYRADALKNHQRIHSGEKPYSCPQCPKQFRQRGDREKHIRVKHSSDGPANPKPAQSYQDTPRSSRVGAPGKRQRRSAGESKKSRRQISLVEECSDYGAQMADGSQAVYVGDVSLPASLFQPILNDIDML